MALKLASFDDVLRELDTLNQKKINEPAAAAQLAHCAQSIEFCVTGYPVLRSWLFRNTLGRIGKAKFLRAGVMTHDTDAPSLGASTPEEKTVDAAVHRLRKAVETFRAHTGEYQPHLAYGTCTRDELEKLQAMHVANHLDVLTASANAPAQVA
jgi:tellurite resistance protein